jgi:hypothetical protein
MFLGACIFATTVFAQQQQQQQQENECDWYCWVERKIDRLEQQIERITRLLVSLLGENGKDHISHDIGHGLLKGHVQVWCFF